MLPGQNFRTFESCSCKLQRSYPLFAILEWTSSLLSGASWKVTLLYGIVPSLILGTFKARGCLHAYGEIFSPHFSCIAFISLRSLLYAKRTLTQPKLVCVHVFSEFVVLVDCQTDFLRKRLSCCVFVHTCMHVCFIIPTIQCYDHRPVGKSMLRAVFDDFRTCRSPSRSSRNSLRVSAGFLLATARYSGSLVQRYVV